MSDTNEQTLVAQAQEDAQAFAALYDRYINRIYGYVYRQTQNKPLTQDLTAATFEKALRHIRKYRWQGTSFGAWLYQIARNELAQHYRRQRFLSPLPWIAHTEKRATETAVQTHELQDTLKTALAQLSPKDYEIITLRYYEGLSSAEVAEILGCSTDNVYLRLHRALKRLQQQLKALESTREAQSYAP